MMAVAEPLDFGSVLDVDGVAAAAPDDDDDDADDDEAAAANRRKYIKSPCFKLAVANVCLELAANSFV